MQKRLIIFLILIFFVAFQSEAQIKFIENKGQFNENVEAKLALNAGDVYFEKNRIKYSLLDKNKITDIHHHRSRSKKVKGHNYNVVFENSLTPSVDYNKKLSPYYNYYIGNDTTKWASRVPLYEELIYNELYNAIDLKYYSSYGQLKYDFIIHVGGEVNDIGWEYEGVDFSLQKGHIILETSLGKVVEQSPYAYQMIDGEETKVECYYVDRDGIIGFECGDYDKTQPLIIDPVLIFATFTGSTSDNWGYTATYDDDENTYIGGIVFGSGYPVTPGAFEINFSGGTGVPTSNGIYPGEDIAISKFSPGGGALLYSTYLGGSGEENPTSLVCNQNGELHVLGLTSSLNFPVSSNAYNTSFNGGAAVIEDDVLNYTNGTDGIVTKFTSDGTAIIGSTYFGGSGNDALNISNSLFFNYGDPFRGEIIIDNNGNSWVATTTQSTDIPIVNGIQSNYGGGSSDALILNFNNDLSSLLWSSYYGGSSDDAAYSLQMDSQNNLIFSGGTNSTDLVMAGNSYHSSSIGGIDGYVVKLSSSSSTLLSSSYVGTSQNDQSYFVQLDMDDNIYLYGQTQSLTYPTTNNVYKNSGSGQFIHCFSPDLSTTVFSTVFGSGNGINISPSAFLVSDCKLIFISGWGGWINQNYGVVGGSTHGMPLTSDAFQSSTDGSDFYLAVFSPYAKNLMYGTYFGGPVSHEHVDGGTSRFDKKGNVYQAVCAGCGGHSDFPTTSGSWSTTNNSSNCNLGVFKFALNKIQSSISLPTVSGCKSVGYTFNNESQGGNIYYWDFGDGTTSNEFQPTHLFPDTGTYSIKLVVSDSLGCFSSDTTYTTLDVFDIETNASLDTTICPGDTVFIWASGGDTYQWITDYNIVSDNDSSYVFPYNSTAYNVLVTNDKGCSNMEQINVNVYSPPYVTAGPDLDISYGESIQLQGATNSTNFIWQPEDSISCDTCIQPFVDPITTTQYIISVVDSNGCINSDTVLVILDGAIYVPNTFTPNGDGVNDVFVVKGKEIKTFEFWIFDRWGELIFHTNNMNVYWDGTFGGRPVQIDTYIWKMEYEDYQNHYGNLIGHVNVIR